jgi:hypothetical protein
MEHRFSARPIRIQMSNQDEIKKELEAAEYAMHDVRFGNQ